MIQLGCELVYGISMPELSQRKIKVVREFFISLCFRGSVLAVPPLLAHKICAQRRGRTPIRTAADIISYRIILRERSYRIVFYISMAALLSSLITCDQP